MSCLNSIPSKALSCVIRIPSPMPNKAAKKSIYKVPTNPLDMLHQNTKEKISKMKLQSKRKIIFIAKQHECYEPGI